MADAITITDADRIAAENLLEQFLTDKFQGEADFSKGGSLRDLAIGALAYIFAYLQKERDYIRARQSLLLLGALAGTDVDDAVDEILSNWFISRKTGRKAKGTVTIYLSKSVSVTVPTTTIFYKATNLMFVPDASVALAYGPEDLLAIRDSTGEISSYSLTIPVTAASAGSEYNIAAGPFADYTRFSGYILRVENQNAFTGGASVETTTELLDRSATAISERSLNSPRAIDATLRDLFSQIDSVSVVGYGDPEMLRDLIPEVAIGTKLHAGGCVDAFIRTPLTLDKTFTGAVGGVFTDNRPFLTSFRDDTVSSSEFSSVQVGDIIHIYNNLPESEANLYVVKAVSAHGLEVSFHSPFPGTRPTVDTSLDDGSVPGGNAHFFSTSRKFIDIEVSFADDGVVEAGGSSLQSSAYRFSANDIGKWIQITGSSIGSNGIWRIVAIHQSPTNSVELRASTGASPSFLAESSLTWNLLLSTDHEKFVRIYGASNPENNGTWKIGDVIDEHTVSLLNADFTTPSFVAESPLSWQLCSAVVEYSVGGNSPSFNNRIARRFSGQFTNAIQLNGCIVLPGEPIYQVKDVSFADGTSPYAGADQRVHFPIRSNTIPEYLTPASYTSLQYQVYCTNPEESQSGWQRMVLRVGWPDGAGEYEQQGYFNGKSLRVTYDTLTGYDSVWSYMLNGDQRILCGSVIPRGFHPIYISLQIRYRLAKNATEGLDETAAAQALADYINDSRSDDPVDVSDLMYFLRSTYVVLGYVEPFDLYYDLLAPDGRVIHYRSSDVISLDPSLQIDPETGYIPNPGDRPELILQDPMGLGVSTNTVRYLSLPELIAFEQLS